jgi:putative hydrolase of the HAD superfamily
VDDAPPLDVGAVEVPLFDLGGVVFEFDFARAFTHWARAAGVEPSALAARFARDAAYEEYERGRIDSAEYFDALRHGLDLDLSDDLLIEGWNGIFGPLLPGVDALLRAAAARFPLFALSNTNAAHERAWSGRYDEVLGRFTAVLTSHDLGHRKPDAACYEAAVACLGVAPGAVLFFDDLTENVIGAREAGMQAVQVTASDTLARTLRGLGIEAAPPG